MTNQQKIAGTNQIKASCALVALGGCVDIQGAGFVQRGRTRYRRPLLSNSRIKMVAAPLSAPANFFIYNPFVLDADISTNDGISTLRSFTTTEAKQNAVKLGYFMALHVGMSIAHFNSRNNERR